MDSVLMRVRAWIDQVDQNFPILYNIGIVNDQEYMMAGFVDVSNMSDLEIKRLGQADDVDEPVRSQRRRGWTTGPRPTVTRTVDQAWALAVTVDRANDGYYKDSQYRWDDEAQRSVLVREANKTIIYRMFEDPATQFSDADVTAGRELRSRLSQELVMTALRGELSGFQKAQQTLLSLTEFVSSDRLNLAVLASQPNSQRVSDQRNKVADRLRGTQPLTDSEGTQVRVTGEVIKCNWSEKWSTYYVTVVTTDGFQVYFAHRQSPAVGSTVTAQGAVKRHAQDSTQLNRVRLF